MKHIDRKYEDWMLVAAFIFIVVTTAYRYLNQ